MAEIVVRRGLAFEGNERMDVVGELNVGDQLPSSPLDFFDPARGMIRHIALTDIPRVKIINTVNEFRPPESKTCQIETRQWEATSAELPAGITVIVISKEDPQAVANWGVLEHINRVRLLSAKNGTVAQDLGAELQGAGNWPKRLFRQVIVADENNRVVYKQEILNQEEEPDYDAAIEAAMAALGANVAS